MPVLLITYTLKHRRTYDYSALEVALAKLKPKNLSKGCWVIKTNKTPKGVYLLLKKEIHKDDYLVVLTVVRPGWVYHDDDVFKWLKANLPPLSDPRSKSSP